MTCFRALALQLIYRAVAANVDTLPTPLSLCCRDLLKSRQESVPDIAPSNCRALWVILIAVSTHQSALFAGMWGLCGLWW